MAAVAAAAVANVGAFFMKDMGVVGVVGTAGAYLGLLVLTSGVDVFRSTLVFMLVMASYWGLGTYVVDRTPLDPYQIGGPTKVMLTGGFEAEPLDSDGDGEADLVGE